MKKSYNKSNGITLVALIVTVIILLILAGISIMALTNSGLIKQTQDAKEKTEEMQKKENTTLNEYENEINKYLNSKYIDGNEAEADKIDTWLQCANIDDFYTLEEILKNKDDILTTLMNSENAVNYMIRSNGDIMEAVCNNEQSMKKMGESVYAGYKAVCNNDWNQAICESSYAETFDNTSETISQMTEEISQLTSSGQYGTKFEAWRLFDGIKGTGDYNTWNSGTNSGWVQYQYNNSCVVYKIAIYPRGDSYNSRFPKDVELLCSSDGVEYETIYSGTVDGYDTKWHYILPTNVKEGTYYKLNCLNTYGGNELQISEMQIYSRSK